MRERQSFKSLEEAMAYAASVDDGIRREGQAALALKGGDRTAAIRPRCRGERGQPLSDEFTDLAHFCSDFGAAKHRQESTRFNVGG
jgi:hypothetical protein